MTKPSTLAAKTGCDSRRDRNCRSENPVAAVARRLGFSPRAATT